MMQAPTDSESFRADLYFNVTESARLHVGRVARLATELRPSLGVC